MIYRDPQPITPNELELIIAAGSPVQICAALVDGVHSIADYEWLEVQCLKLLSSDNTDVQGVAITCIGHLARLHGKLNLHAVSTVLAKTFEEKPELRGRIDDAIDDIRVFMKTDLTM
jgi:hypothetical protein